MHAATSTRGNFLADFHMLGSPKQDARVSRGGESALLRVGTGLGAVKQIIDEAALDRFPVDAGSGVIQRLVRCDTDVPEERSQRSHRRDAAGREQRSPSLPPVRVCGRRRQRDVFLLAVSGRQIAETVDDGL